MKKLCIALFGILSLLFISCDKDENVDGKSSDTIKLSQKTASFDSSSHTITITTKGDGWWVNAIALDKTAVPSDSFDKLSKNFVVTKPEFQVERKDGKTIIITMNKNTTNAERILYVDLQAGNYFDGIAVTQSK